MTEDFVRKWKPAREIKYVRFNFVDQGRQKIQAPLGWDLSEEARTAIRQQLSAKDNQKSFATVRNLLK